MMLIDEACKLLGLDATTPEVWRNELMQQLQIQIEGKIAMAPTAQLKENHSATLAKLQEAIVLIKQAAENGNLPTLNEDGVAEGDQPRKQKFWDSLANPEKAIELIARAARGEDISALTEDTSAAERNPEVLDSPVNPEDAIEVIEVVASEGGDLPAPNGEDEDGEDGEDEDEDGEDEEDDEDGEDDEDDGEDDDTTKKEAAKRKSGEGDAEDVEELEEFEVVAGEWGDEEEEDEGDGALVLRIEKRSAFDPVSKFFGKINKGFNSAILSLGNTCNRVLDSITSRALKITGNKFVRVTLMVLTIITLIIAGRAGWWMYESPRREKAIELTKYAQDFEAIQAWGKAAEIYQEALDVKPRWQDAMDGIYRVKLELGRQIKGLLAKAKLDQDKEQWRSALGHLKKAARLDPDDAEIQESITKLENLIATLRGDLVVKTTPEEATVSIGRKKQQISPASYQDLALGTYVVAVNKKGYKPIKKEILIKKGENVLGPLPLERIKGALSINTEPQGANYVISQVKSEASLDKKFEPRRGQAPAVEPDLPTGNYLIKIERLGWMDDELNVNVRGVQEAEVNLRFANLDETLNLQDPETLGKILENAQDIKELHLRDGQEEELVYNPKSGTPCTGWIKKMYHSGRVRSLFSVKDGKKDGFWTSWHENGQKWVEMNYKDSKLHGPEIHWREDGQKVSETTYQEGKLHGPEIHWRKNGEKRSETYYENGQKHGLEIYWREDGNKELETEYLDGKQHGLTTEWHMNGQKKRESNFVDNELDGLSTSWDKDGRQKYRIEYKHGKRHGLTTEWHSNGQKSSETDWKNGKPHGLSTSWNDKGQKRSETRYKDGQIVR